MSKRFATLLCCAMLLGALSGCKEILLGGENAVDLGFFDRAQPAAFSELHSSFVTLDQASIGNSDLAQRQNRVIRSQAAYEAFWQRLHANVTPMPAPPAVDFSKEVVLAVVLGVRSSSGYGIAIEQVSVSGSSTGVLVAETIPGESCMTLSVMTSPYHLVKTSAPASNVQFVDVKRTVSCD